MNMKKFRITKMHLLLLAGVLLTNLPCLGQKGRSSFDIFNKSNLVAWCIVPYDVKNRNSEERAQMLLQLGITKMAYDWREKNIPEFDTEIQTLKKHHIKLQSFWLMSGADPAGEGNLKLVLDALKRNHVKTEIWLDIDGIDLSKMTQEEKVAVHARSIKYIVEEAAKIGCTVALYNDEGWYGEPENQLAIIDYLKMPEIGMVYNFHHAQDQVDRFPEFFPKILPRLRAITVAGLKGRNPAKVVPVGQGDQEYELMRIVKASAYRGPINILNEETRPDAEEGLQLNMDGFVDIIKALGDTAALKTYGRRK